jgi:hypothetical protein
MAVGRPLRAEGPPRWEWRVAAARVGLRGRPGGMPP